MVTKIVYSPVGFLDLRDAKNSDTRIKDELEESSHSTNSLEIKFGRFVEVCAGVLGAQHFLTRYYRAQELVIQCLKRFKNLTKLRVDCDNSDIGAEDISTAFGGLHVSRNTCVWRRGYDGALLRGSFQSQLPNYCL